MPAEGARATVRRLALGLANALPSLAGVVVITFVLTRALPGDTAAYFAGPAASAEAVEEARQKLGLDRPLPVQFVDYLRELARGDLGTSLTTGQPVLTEMAGRLPASLELTWPHCCSRARSASRSACSPRRDPAPRSITRAASARRSAWRCRCSSPACC
jgi:ABC-type microcin C transport system permease subunit YejB